MCLRSFVAAAIVLSIGVAARADLLGDKLHVIYDYPNAISPEYDFGNITVPGAGAIGLSVPSFVLSPDADHPYKTTASGLPSHCLQRLPVHRRYPRSRYDGCCCGPGFDPDGRGDHIHLKLHRCQFCRRTWDHGGRR